MPLFWITTRSLDRDDRGVARPVTFSSNRTREDDLFFADLVNAHDLPSRLALISIDWSISMTRVHEIYADSSVSRWDTSLDRKSTHYIS